MPRPVLFATSAEDSRISIQKYQDIAAKSISLQERTPFARAWYAIPEKDGWIFAPSKWAGHSGINESSYLDKETPQEARKTEARLAQWFEVVPEAVYQHDVLHEALRKYLGTFSREPSKMARISVPKTILHKDEAPETVAQLVVRLIRALTPDQQTEIIKALT
jgi:hypothetical protein